jgi:heavy metal response regulator
MRILVVEDQASVASFIVKGLREERFAVDWVADGREAIITASAECYDVIVLDIMLPGCDGFGVTKALRRDGIASPILMLTAKGDIDSRVRGLDAGADDYLTKPFAFAELVARIRALLRRSGQSVEPTLQLADLHVDPATHQVQRDQQTIELTAKEYGLLEYLLRNRDRVCTRTSIIEHVWDMHFDSDTNLVDVYIRYLRRKIDEPFARKLIHTVRGVGYIMKESE